MHDTLEITARPIGAEWLATCKEIPDLIEWGDTSSEAIEDLEEAIETYLHSRTLH